MGGVIKNAKTLGSSDARQDALAIAEAGYAAVDVGNVIRRRVRVEGDDLCVLGRRVPLPRGRVFFIGVGKCAIAAAEAIEQVLGKRLAGGIALDVRGISGDRLGTIETFVGTHPKPSEKNIDAARRIVKLLNDSEEDDLVLMLISGGGSALLCLHGAPMTCLDEGILFDELTAKGASIQELNTVRKHTSYARGGGLAQAAYPAKVFALIVSDVPGNDIEYIASGPTVKDSSTIADAEAVLSRFGIPPPPGGFLETPKESKFFERVTNLLFVTNRTALEAMERAATERGYAVNIADDAMQGEAKEVAHLITARLHGASSRTALLYGGECTVTLPPEHGEGGRNQELALAALNDLARGELLLPFSSDGRDANAHAGAIADELTLKHAGAKRLLPEEYLARHASFDFFAASGDALETGLLESNVSDLVIALKH